MYQQQRNLEAHTSTPKAITRFTSFSGIPKSTTKVKAASNFQRYNPVPLVLSVNSYRLIFIGNTPNVHLVPSRNSNDKKIYLPQPSLLCYIVPREIQAPPLVQSLTFQVPEHPLSHAIHPLTRFHHIVRYKNQGISFPQN